LTFWVGQSRRFDDSKPAAQNKTKPFQARMFHSLILTYQASFWLYAHSGVSVASSLALPVVRNLFETITTRSQLCHFDEITLARSHLDVASVSDIDSFSVDLCCCRWPEFANDLFKFEFCLLRLQLTQWLSFCIEISGPCLNQFYTFENTKKNSTLNWFSGTSGVGNEGN